MTSATYNYFQRVDISVKDHLGPSYGASFTAANTQYCAIADTASLSFVDVEFTISCWVKLSTLTGTQALVTKWAAAAANQEYALFWNLGADSKLSFSVSDGSTVTKVQAATTVAVDTWYFVLGWHDPATDKVYISVNNATAVEAAHSTGCRDGNNAFQIGKDHTSNYFSGVAQRVVVWNRLLTSTERTYLYNLRLSRTYSDIGLTNTDGSALKTSLVEWWELNEIVVTSIGSYASLSLTANGTPAPTLVSGVGFNTQTVIYSFTNKFLKDSSTGHVFWPLLRSISDITLGAGEYLPTLSVGAITLDNRRGSFGANRKFGDVLEKYTAIEQDVTIYIGAVDNDTDTVSSWTQIAKAKVAKYECAIDAKESTITFDLLTDLVSRHTLSLEVATTVTGMSTAPAQSIGKSASLIQGDAPSYVPMVRITANGVTNPKYAVATTLKGHLTSYVRGLNYVFMQDDRGNWLKFGTNTDRTGDTSTGQYALNAYAAQAYAFDVKGTALSVRLTAKGSGVGAFTSSAQLTVFILRYDATTFQVVDEIVRGQTALAAYDADNQAGTTSFNIDISFDRPAVFFSDNGKYGYALGWSCTNYNANDCSLHYMGTATRAFLRNAASSADVAEWSTTTTSVYKLRAALRDPTFTWTASESGYTDNGLSYTSVLITQPTAGSGQLNPHFDNVQFVTSELGAPYPEGGSPTYEPEQVIRQLDYTWTGNYWVDNSRWDVSRYSSYYSALGTVSGHFDYRITFDQLVMEICKSMACRIGLLSSGKLFLYPWGNNYTSAASMGAISPMR